MTEKESREGNKLIAQFMGYKVSETGDTTSDARDGGRSWNLYHKNGITTDAVYYDVDWASLMPVVEKIENLDDNRYMFEICGMRSEISILADYSNFRYEGGYTISEFHAGNSSSKIEAVWLSIVKFIEFYNEGKNDQEGN